MTVGKKKPAKGAFNGSFKGSLKGRDEVFDASPDAGDKADSSSSAKVKFTIQLLQNVQSKLEQVQVLPISRLMHLQIKMIWLHQLRVVELLTIIIIS